MDPIANLEHKMKRLRDDLQLWVGVYGLVNAIPMVYTKPYACKEVDTLHRKWMTLSYRRAVLEQIPHIESLFTEIDSLYDSLLVLQSAVYRSE